MIAIISFEYIFATGKATLRDVYVPPLPGISALHPQYHV